MKNTLISVLLIGKNKDKNTHEKTLIKNENRHIKTLKMYI